ncbi:aldolase/citrate lyase family protein [Mameliella alba]|uniref:aldolase/citrate lyase family protein n=1 Tax=Mameliella alba TaxID=561184 RepID=UPI00256EB970|nr:aldolase/citrate lyase family protein [Mameliella alba]
MPKGDRSGHRDGGRCPQRSCSGKVPTARPALDHALPAPAHVSPCPARRRNEGRQRRGDGHLHDRRPKGPRCVEEIAAVDGLDMLLVGANDLSNTLGLPGQLDQPDVQAGFQRVTDACKANNIYFGVGGMGHHPELAKEMIAMGARHATAGADVTFMTKAAIANALKFD